VNGFKEYYAASAWIVENLALLQARIVYASDAMREPVASALRQAQRITAPSATVSQHIHDVRRKISEQHYSSNVWDIKYVWGGMMDLQWILKGLLAKYALRHPLPEQHQDTCGHIYWLHRIAAIDSNQQQLLLEAHRIFHTVLSYTRLCHGKALDENNLTDGLKQLLADVTGMKDYVHLRKYLLRLQAQIYHMYQNLSYM
jgi:[glutamine synthetase] adenylyltransferase / [glutamine synthetase]-adenylyl-L-tyrosine phosphorylase